MAHAGPNDCFAEFRTGVLPGDPLAHDVLLLEHEHWQRCQFDDNEQFIGSKLQLRVGGWQYAGSPGGLVLRDLETEDVQPLLGSYCNVQYCQANNQWMAIEAIILRGRQYAIENTNSDGLGLTELRAMNHRDVLFAYYGFSEGSCPEDNGFWLDGQCDPTPPSKYLPACQLGRKCQSQMLLQEIYTPGVYTEPKGGKRCTYKGASPPGFCSGEADCFEKGRDACDQDPECKGVMWSSVWPGGVRTDGPTTIQASDRATWFSMPAGTSWSLSMGTCSSDAGCQWIFEPSETRVGAYYIKVAGGTQYIHASGGTSSGQPLTMHDCPKENNNANCQWILEPSSTRPGTYYIRASDREHLELDRATYIHASGGTSAGKYLTMHSCPKENNYPNCQWKLIWPGSVPGTAVKYCSDQPGGVRTDGPTTIQASDRATWFSMPAGTSWSSLSMGTCSSDAGCQWIFEPSETRVGAYYIKVAGGTQYIHASGGTSSGQPLTMHDCPKENNNANCQWILEPSSTRPGTYYIRASDRATYIHASGGTSAGKYLTMHSCAKENNYPNCQWKLIWPGSVPLTADAQWTSVALSQSAYRPADSNRCVMVSRGPGGCGAPPYMAQGLTGTPNYAISYCLANPACIKVQWDSHGNIYPSDQQSGVQATEPNGGSWSCLFKECPGDDPQGD